jgi:predicted ATPase
MLKKLRIKNFKSWKDTGEIDLAPITMFFGGNSSGKTSLLQFILMLKQTAEAEDYSSQILKFNGIVNLGNFKDVVFGHDKKNAIEFNILRDVESAGKGFFNLGIKGFRAVMAEESSKIKIEDFEITDPTYIKKDSKKKDVASFDRSQFLHEITKKLKNHKNSKEDDALMKEDFVVRKIWRNEVLYPFVSRLEYIGPLRQQPLRHYQWNNNYPTEMGAAGEFAIQAIIASNLQKGDLENEVAKALKKMGLIDSFKVKSLSKDSDEHYKVLVKITKGSTEVSLPDVGSGVSQILPILTALYNSKPGAIILLEHPEIHLHPKAQIELADIIVDAVKRRKIQVIIESHSEHFLTRIQTRVADGEISKNSTKLYFCKNEKGFSELEELIIEDSGRIDNWPPNFFGNMLEETSNRVRAFRNRKDTKN